MDKVKKTVETIPLPKELHTRAKMGVAQAKKKKRKKWIIPVAASVFLASSITVGATMNGQLQNLLWMISPDIAVLLEPIHQTVEHEGIKMEVVTAMQDEDMTVIYVTMQDVEGNRIDETLDIYDYWVSKGSSFNAERIHFDEATNTALIRFMTFNGFKMDKLQILIRSFLSDKSVLEDVPLPVDLDKITHQQTELLPDGTVRGRGGAQLDDQDYVLPAGKLDVKTPLYNGMKITNIGLNEGKLHVQVEWLANDAIDHGTFHLVNAAGEKIHPNNSISYGRDENRRPIYAYNYEEIIFDTKGVNLEEYSLQTTIYASGNHVEGNWRTTFKLDEVKNKSLLFTADFDDWMATELKISPLGLTIIGEGDSEQSEDMSATIGMKDGQVYELNGAISFSEKNQVKMKLLSEEVIDVEQIKTVMINGREVEL